MAYTPYEWKDGASGGTPITAERLNALEQGIANIELEPGPEGPRGPEGPEGPEGPRGPAGNDGEEGPRGPAGTDGFPTETQWNDLVARVEALEP